MATGAAAFEANIQSIIGEAFDAGEADTGDAKSKRNAIAGVFKEKMREYRVDIKAAMYVCKGKPNTDRSDWYPGAKVADVSAKGGEFTYTFFLYECTDKQ